MTEIIAWVETYYMQLLVGAFFALQFLMVIMIAVASHRIALVRRNMKAIMTQVEHYLSVVLEADAQPNTKEEISRQEKRRMDEQENQIISTVLKEIFP